MDHTANYHVWLTVLKHKCSHCFLPKQGDSEFFQRCGKIPQSKQLLPQRGLLFSGHQQVCTCTQVKEVNINK